MLMNDWMRFTDPLGGIYHHFIIHPEEVQGAKAAGLVATLPHLAHLSEG